LGIQVAFQEKSLGAATFAQDVCQSNQIWLGQVVRIELPIAQLPKLLEESSRVRVVNDLRALGGIRA
jgi:hypothetical protein